MSTINQREQRIIETVNSLRDDIIDFACRLVAEPSTLEKEFSVINVMETELRKLSFEPVRIPINPSELSKHPGFAPVPWEYNNRENIIGLRNASGHGGRSVLFNGHLDVVSPEPIDFWDLDPFKPVLLGGWLYGRGAGDMKAGIAAMTYAVHAVDKSGFGFNAPVTIEGVIEEECSGNGALACLNAGYDAEAVLIPEPFGPTILTSQVGVLWFKVSVRGVACHVQSTSSGTNSIEKSILLMSALRRLEAELNDPEMIPKPYRDIEHPLNLNIGIFQGGDWPSTVPASAEFHCRMSYFPDTSFKEISKRIMQTVKNTAEADPWLRENTPKIDFYGFRSDGHSLSRNIPALRTLSQCHKELTGQDVTEYISTCTTDVRAFHFFGKGEATCYGPVAENIHGANERVNLESVIHVARTYALFLSRWCGLTE
ncbi:MAG: ArgE/DapE family deacylase [Thermodesulfobacteriota bacterium]|jgi:acetylornithine deacetylase